MNFLVQEQLNIRPETPKLLQRAKDLMNAAQDKSQRLNQYKRMELWIEAGIELRRAADNGNDMTTRQLARALDVRGVNHLVVFYCTTIAEKFNNSTAEFRKWNISQGKNFTSLAQVYKYLFPNPLRVALSNIRSPLEAIIKASNLLYADLANPDKYEVASSQLLQASDHIRAMVPPTEQLVSEYIYRNAPCVCCGSAPPPERFPLYRVRIKKTKINAPICNACATAQPKRPIDYQQVAWMMFVYAQNAKRDLDMLTNAVEF